MCSGSGYERNCQSKESIFNKKCITESKAFPVWLVQNCPTANRGYMANRASVGWVLPLGEQLGDKGGKLS